MNDELISKNALMREIDWLNRSYPDDCNNEVAAKIVKLIETACAVDAVEVVRCKYCNFSRPVHREDGSVFEGTLHCFTGRGYQQNVFGREYSVISPNSFCAAGKRKMDVEVEGC